LLIQQSISLGLSKITNKLYRTDTASKQTSKMPNNEINGKFD